MAQLELEADRLPDPAAWPDVCARCGASGTAPVPVPAKHLKGVRPFAVPLCPAHRDDWATVRFRNRVGMVGLLLGMAGTVGVVWELHPRFARPNEQNDLARASSAFFFGLVAVMPFAAAVAWWAKTPIRVSDRVGRKAVLVGVGRAFARAVRAAAAPPALPAVADGVRFDVSPYRPPRACPADVAAKAVAVSAVAGVLFGVAVGLAWWAVRELAAGWAPNDGRFLLLTGGTTVALTAGVFGVRVMAVRPGIALGLVLAGVTVLAVLVLRLVGVPLRHGFAVVLAGGPLLVLCGVAIHPVVRNWRVRSGVVAALVGAGGPVAFAGGLAAVLGVPAADTAALYVVAGLAALAFQAVARAEAARPYCAACDGWLAARRVGALRRPRADVAPALEDGRVVALAGLTPYLRKAEVGDVELTVHACPDCRPAGTLVLELKDCVGGGKNGRTPMLVPAGRWLYPGEALAVVDELFPPPAEPAEAPPGPAEGA